MTASAIRLAGLRVGDRNAPVLQLDDLSVAPGQIVAVIGPNGAGKSTLLRTLALLQPFTGAYWIDGQRLAGRAGQLAWRRQMATVFQQPLLLRGTVFQNVSLGLRLRRLPRSLTKARVLEWLERLGVAHLRTRPVQTLSGGEAQRVNLARALVLQPRILFLDEPFAALDAPTRQTLAQDLGTLLRAASVTALFATHDFLEVLTLADRVVALEGGRAVQDDTPAEVLRQPATATVRALTTTAVATIAAAGRGAMPR